ncbi:MAG: hypothetical protein WC975_01385 [Phycisphaerae bacterium]
MYENVACAGIDVHYKFSKMTFRDAQGEIVRRERLLQWPKGLPVVLEASFGWGWLSDLMDEVGQDVHLSNCYKVEQMRKARGRVKNKIKETLVRERVSSSSKVEGLTVKEICDEFCKTKDGRYRRGRGAFHLLFVRRNSFNAGAPRTCHADLSLLGRFLGGDFLLDYFLCHC